MQQEIIEIRNLTIQDYADLKSSMLEVYSHWPGAYWREHQLKKLLDIFPEGQLGISVNGKIVGCALSIIVKYSRFGDQHTYQEITDNYTFDTHNPLGDVLYGVDLFISPDYRGMRLGRRLYDARKELCEKLNLRAIVFGGRIPNFHKYSDVHSPKEYIAKVKHKEIHDPTLSFQLSNDFHVKKILKGYMAGDKESEDVAILLQWDNIYYADPAKSGDSRKTVLRLGLVQWQMRLYKSIDELYGQIEYFVDAVSAYRSDFVLFPELFNAPLMAEYNHLSEGAAIRKIAEQTEAIRQKFSTLAVHYNVNIITGSLPAIREDGLYNVGYLCRRNGSYEEYEKLHITPDEAKSWGMRGGSKLQTFDTDCGKIGILICYDVEFPELSRLLAEQKMEVLFVPFLTDSQNGYARVRHCAQARAIENECYVAIAGSVGNLPQVHNMDIQYAQSAVFTPCDFAFPPNGIKSEATPNAEMVLIVDVDLELLKDLHAHGSVRNLKDRRTDLYQLAYQRATTKTNQPVGLSLLTQERVNATARE
ncbi:MAG TPA: bifunctional GNAT family N-acetyltransferase/carbon-nitrogen hydrolase family protein [Cytophagales bacterium]